MIMLLLMPPLFGELLTSATPPFAYLNPISIFFFVLIYGIPVLLVREAKVRWNLKFSTIFLAATIGILIEGIIMQSFFNVSHPNLADVSGYGVVLGLQFPWTLVTIASHGIISCIIPIVLLDTIWPKFKNKPFLSKKATIVTLALGIVSVIITSVAVVTTLEEFKDHTTNPGQIVFSVFVILLLIGLARISRNVKVEMKHTHLASPITLGLASFFGMFALVLLPFILAASNISSNITIVVQIVTIVISIIFFKSVVSNSHFGARHLSAVVIGALMLFISMTPIHEMSGIFGMSIVGLIYFILLMIWRKRIIRLNN